MFVRKEHEGDGIGRALLDEAVGWLRVQGVAAASLTTEPGTRADRFYQRAGWRRGELVEGGDVAYELDLLAQSVAGAPDAV